VLTFASTAVAGSLFDYKIDLSIIVLANGAYQRYLLLHVAFKVQRTNFMKTNLAVNVSTVVTK
jgi:hypothetical protein